MVLDIIVAAVVGYAISGLWYSPALFYDTWLDLAGLDHHDSSWSTVVIGAFATLCMAGVLSLIVNFIASTWLMGAGIGLLAWFGFIATTTINAVIYAGEPWGLFFLEAGHYLVVLVVMGALIGWL
jgi:hypothetical protein